MPFGPKVDLTVFLSAVDPKEVDPKGADPKRSIPKSSDQRTQVSHSYGTDKCAKTSILSLLLGRSIVKDLCGVEGSHGVVL